MLGIKEVEENAWLESFMEHDLGYIDLEAKSLQPRENPFAAVRVYFYVSGTLCNPRVRY